MVAQLEAETSLGDPTVMGAREDEVGADKVAEQHYQPTQDEVVEWTDLHAFHRGGWRIICQSSGWMKALLVDLGNIGW